MELETVGCDNFGPQFYRQKGRLYAAAITELGMLLGFRQKAETKRTDWEEICKNLFGKDVSCLADRAQGERAFSRVQNAISRRCASHGTGDSPVVKRAAPPSVCIS